MLSFLRDQGGVSAPSRKGDATGKGSANGVEPSQEEKFLTVAAHEGRTRRSTILLAVLFIAGLLCLWFMIKKSTPSAAMATTTGPTEEAKLEAALARLTGFKSEIFNGMDEIVKKFYEFSNVLQIQVSELAKNPFSSEFFMRNKKEESKVERAPQMDMATIWREEIQKKAEALQLVSVVQSDQGTCCMIGDKILREGDSIQEFKVQQIGDDFVKVEWAPEQDERPPGTESEHIEIVLKLSK
jgi:preprotein translocase subunit SecG